MIEVLVVLLAAAVLCVWLSRRLGLGSVLGYLIGGALIGPSRLRMIVDVDRITEISELGVVMLLFPIWPRIAPAAPLGNAPRFIPPVALAPLKGGGADMARVFKLAS